MTAKALVNDLAAESRLLEVEEAGGALQVGQGGGVAARQALELAARGDLELERVHELRIVPLEDAEEVGDLAVDVVDDLGPGAPVAPEEDAAQGSA